MPTFQESLKAAYEQARRHEVADFLNTLSTRYFCENYPKRPDWAIGPFRQEPVMTFAKTWQWPDPTGIGWESTFIFNPSLLEDRGRLYLFYRASPKKESLCSRIGLAWSDDGGRTWEDCPNNPILYPTQDNEILGCEDPKIYRHEGQYYLFYHGIFRPDEETRRQVNATSKLQIEFATDMQLATSTDLVHWEKRGLIVPREISKYWAKAAVIARNPQGEPVRINGQFMMFISEGCGMQQHVGYSTDMLHWRFEPQTFLELPPALGSLYEVACAVTDHEPTGRYIVMDFYYARPDGSNAGGQALYYKDNPTRMIERNDFGASLSWGGLMQLGQRWLFAQGWDSPPGKAEIYFYSAPVE